LLFGFVYNFKLCTALAQLLWNLCRSRGLTRVGDTAFRYRLRIRVCLGPPSKHV
jgi:hypothetical protein